MKKRKLLVGLLSITFLLVVGAAWLYGQQPPTPQETSKGTPSSNQPKVVVVASPPIEPRAPTSSSAITATASLPTVGIRIANNNIVANVRTTVLVTAGINDSAVISNSVNLLRIGATGTQSTILGVMHDDGINGDELAGDNVYTIAITFNEATTTTITLQVSAAFKNRLQRVLSVQQVIAVITEPDTFTHYTNSQQNLQLQYPSKLQPGQSGDALTWSDPAYPDLEPIFQIASSGESVGR